jgi:predicted nucleotidyltransferase
LNLQSTPRKVSVPVNPLTAIQEHLAEFRALGARRIGVFGSFVRGDARPDSDVDVYVEFDDHQRTYDNYFDLHEGLELLFGRPVDLVTDRSLTETQARLILPTVRYAALHG